MHLDGGTACTPAIGVDEVFGLGVGVGGYGYGYVCICHMSRRRGKRGGGQCGSISLIRGSTFLPCSRIEQEIPGSLASSVDGLLDCLTAPTVRASDRRAEDRSGPLRSRG